MFSKELSIVPTLPGCYLMKNNKGVVIYVGKAKNLKNRLKSYFNGRTNGKTTVLVSEITSFEYIITNSETEAFILENNLIKKYSPKYNILLRDDKSYPYIELTNEKIPRLIVKREVNINKKNTYLFGPYPNAYAARKMVNLLNRLYPLRKCINMPKKTCLYYYIGECLGYCVNKNIDTDDIKKEILSILNGNNEVLYKKVNDKIKLNSDKLNYEKAIELRDELNYLKENFEKEAIELNDGVNRDIFNYYVDKCYISIQIFFIRNGKLIESSSNILPIISSIEDILEEFIFNFYEKKNITPKEIIVPSNINKEILSELLNVKVINVQKGIKHKLFLTAYTNAKINLEKEINLIYLNEERSYKANKELGNLLNIKDLSIIESFDNSNLFGSFCVSGMVTFIDGLPSKKDYRKYKLSFEKNDDVKSMKEVIYRRYFRVLTDDLIKPELIIVDGGTNQINAAKSVLDELNLDIKVCGLKKNNKHKLESIIDGDNYKSIIIDKQSNVYFLLNRISDEIHRYTINYHKQIRSKGNISSVLDNIEGIGLKRKKDLIKKYGSIKKMKEQTLDELKKTIPDKTAVKLYEFLKEYK